MAVPEVLSVDLLYLIILLVPGLLAVKIFLAITREVDRYSRLTAVVYSLGFAILSVLTLYIGISLLHWSFITAEELNSLTIPNLIWAYFVHTLLALSYGFVFGQARVIADKRGYIDGLVDSIPNLEEMDAREELWDLTFSDIYSDSEIRIVTQEGDILQGEVMRSGTKAQERDLLIADPKRVIIDESGNVEYQFEDYGLYAYVHNQDISYILFDEDLNEADERVVEKYRDSGIEKDDTGKGGPEDDDLEALLEELEAELEFKKSERFESLELTKEDRPSGNEDS